MWTKKVNSGSPKDLGLSLVEVNPGAVQLRLDIMDKYNRKNNSVWFPAQSQLIDAMHLSGTFAKNNRAIVKPLKSDANEK